MHSNRFAALGMMTNKWSFNNNCQAKSFFPHFTEEDLVEKIIYSWSHNMLEMEFKNSNLYLPDNATFYTIKDFQTLACFGIPRVLVPSIDSQMASWNMLCKQTVCDVPQYSDLRARACYLWKLLTEENQKLCIFTINDINSLFLPGYKPVIPQLL